MDTLEKKFLKLGIDNAPGQEENKKRQFTKLDIDTIPGELVDFSHGDVDAFKPIPGSLDNFIEGFHDGAKQAYTEYKGKEDIRAETSQKIANFTQLYNLKPKDLIITPGSQGALFLAAGSVISNGTKVAIIEPDYFANRKLVEFFNGETFPIDLNYFEATEKAGIDIKQLEKSFQSGVSVFIFSNPNNPTGVVYSQDEIEQIIDLANKYNITLIVDELYSRQIFAQKKFPHLISDKKANLDNIVTVMGPSKTESLSGFRLGVAFGSSYIISRMEKLQAIVSLRAGGYNQAVLKGWFNEPEKWMEKRILEHQHIRDDLVSEFSKSEGISIRATEAGSYLFPKIPDLKISQDEFVDILRVKANVIVTPGAEFGEGFLNSFRINFSQDHDLAVKAVRRIIQVIEWYRK